MRRREELPPLDWDEINPYYCTVCRRRIPQKVSDRNAGLCDACLARLQAEEEARRRAEEERRRQEEANRAAQDAARYHADTHRGVCSACGSRNISEYTVTESGGMRELACCLGCFVFWPLLLLVPFLGFRKRYRRCNYCGNEWSV